MISLKEEGIIQRTHKQVAEIAASQRLLDAEVTVLAKPLTAEEAIGKPGRRDFPIIIGKERMVEATLLGSRGQAFTDSPREYLGQLEEVIRLAPTTNQSRAILVATTNALLCHLGKIKKTVHCKDEEPEQCAREIATTLHQKHGSMDVGLIGLNPAIAQNLIETFGPDHVRITDLCREIIGQQRFGVEVWDGASRTEELVEKSDLILFTGTTLINDTFDRIRSLVKDFGKNSLIYGVTAAGICELFDMECICPCGHDGYGS